MSSHSSPAHRYPPEYEDRRSTHYDPKFTEDISLKMRVPDRIRVIGGQYEDDEIPIRKLEKKPPMMMVPDRILVSGHDEHFGIRDVPRELELDRTFQPKVELSGMATPPRILTIEDHEYPTVDEIVHRDHNSQPVVNNGHIPNLNISNLHQSNSSISGRLTPPDVLLSPTEEMALLRRHVSKLSRRVMNLEQDTQQRSQRELLLYSLAFAYFILKGLSWLKRSW